jgi:peptidoglycan/xylan/chitin deacetylase (PgdA/CDA1 family)
MSIPWSKALRLSVFGTVLAVLLVVGLYLLRTPVRAHNVLPPVQWHTGETVVSLEFDDATADQYAVRSLLSSHKMHATFYVNSGTVGSSDFHMNWSQVQRLASDGNEIAGHTVDHVNLLQLEQTDRDEVRREICDDRASLLKLGYPVTDFAYPYGAFGSTTKRIAQQCGYNSARNVSGVVSEATCDGCPFRETIPPGDPYATRTPENVLDTTKLSTIEGYVTEAQRHGGGWVQLVLHHVCSCGQPYAIAPSHLSALLDWLAGQQNTLVDTVQQVLGGPLQPAVNGPAAQKLPGPNLLRNPSLDDTPAGGSLPDCWDTNAFGINTPRWTRTSDAHSRPYAERLDLSQYSSGGAMLLSHFDLGGCAPSVVPGHSYTMSAWFKSTAPVLFYIYTRDSLGKWSWWMNSPVKRPSSSYTQVSYTTRPLPAAATAISIGLGLGQAGSLTTDDYSLLDSHA